MPKPLRIYHLFGPLPLFVFFQLLGVRWQSLQRVPTIEKIVRTFWNQRFRLQRSEEKDPMEWQSVGAAVGFSDKETCSVGPFFFKDLYTWDIMG